MKQHLKEDDGFVGRVRAREREILTLELGLSTRYVVVLFSVWSEGFAVWSRSRGWFKNCLIGENFLKVKWKCHLQSW